MKLSNVKFYDEFKHLNLISFCVYGSRLHGTSTEESDWDFKGVYMPTKRDIYLGNTSNSISFKAKKGEGKNSAEDVDIEIYSLSHFVKLAIKGDTTALDMLHTPNDKIIQTSEIWNELTASREEFYTKNLKSLVGYARSQAAKYGAKGSRLASMKLVLDWIDEIDQAGECCSAGIDKFKINEEWTALPEGEHIYKLPPHKNDTNKLYMYQVCGQSFQETVSIQYMKESILKKYNEYGARAKKAQANEGIDWKAVSHTIRIGFELNSILTVGTIQFPLAISGALRRIKMGEMDYLTEVAPLLDSVIETCEMLSAISDLPEEVDRKRWEDWLVRLIQREVFSEILNHV